MSEQQIPADERPPYLGLRPFDEADRGDFFGRERHVNEIVKKLASQRFVAVIGWSGAGKSSLVLAGVIPEIRKGRMPGAGSDWLIVKMSPGNSPTGRLGDAVVNSVVSYFVTEDWTPSLFPYTEEAERVKKLGDWTARVEASIREGEAGLVRALNQAVLPPEVEILIVVDQFEELFRFDELGSRLRKRAKEDDSEAFVQKLLFAAGKVPAGAEIRTPAEKAEEAEEDELSGILRRIRIIITMRSDFLGDCAGIPGLAEAANEGMYLTPRLTREEMTRAIVFPAKKRKQAIEEALVRRLVNDVVHDPDQLPVLQHVLMRCWGRRDPKRPIDLTDYIAVGGAVALNQHADEAFDEIEKEYPALAPRKITEKLFKRITKPGSKQQFRKTEASALRDAQELGVICDQTAEPLEDVISVIDKFRMNERSFLRPGENERLNKTSVIDITHESLIRKWDKLSKWVKQEETDATAFLELRDRYKKAAEAARKQGEASGKAPVLKLLSESAIGDFRSYFNDKRWNKDWAQRYGGHFEELKTFFDDSVTDLNRKTQNAKRRQALLLAAPFIAAALGVLAAGVFLIWEDQLRHNSRLFNTEIDNASREDQKHGIDERAAAALGAVSLVPHVWGSQPTLEKAIRIDEWEHFGAAREPTLLNQPNPSGDIVVPGGATLSRDGNIGAWATPNGVLVKGFQDGWTKGPFQLDVQGGDGKLKVRIRKDNKYIIFAGNLHEQRVVRYEVVRVADSTTVKSGQFPLSEHDDDGLAYAFFVGEKETAKDTPEVGVLTYYNALFLSTSEKRDSHIAPELLRTAALSDDDGLLLVSGESGKSFLINLAAPASDKAPAPTKLPIETPITAATFFGPNNNCIAVGTGNEGVVRVLKTSKDPGCDEIRTGSPPKAVPPLGGHFLRPDAGAPIRRSKGSNPNGLRNIPFPSTGAPIREIQVGEAPDGTLEVAAGTEKGAFVFGTAYGPQPLRFLPDERILSIDLSRTGGFLLATIGDRKARVFEIRTGEERPRITHPEEVQFASFIAHKPGQIFSVSQAGNGFLTDVAGATNGRTWTDAFSKIHNCDLGQSALAGSTLLFSCDVIPVAEQKGPRSVSVYTWNGNAGQDPTEIQKPAEEKSAIPSPEGSTTPFVLSANGKTLAWANRAACNDNNFQLGIYTVGSKPPGGPSCLDSDLHIDPVLALSADGLRLGVATSNDNTWTAETFQRSTEDEPFPKGGAKRDLPSPGLGVTAMAISNKGYLVVATASKLNDIGLCASQGERCLAVTAEMTPKKTITSLSFAGSSESWLVFGQSDDSLWAAPWSEVSANISKRSSQSGLKPLRSVPMPPHIPSSRIFLSPGGELLAAVSGGQASFLALKDNSWSVSGSLHEPGQIQGLAFLPDDKVSTSVLVKTHEAARPSLTFTTHELVYTNQVKRICDMKSYVGSLQANVSGEWRTEYQSSGGRVYRKIHGIPGLFDPPALCK